VHRRIILAWSAAVVVLAAFTWYSAGSVTHGFVAYYAAARLLVTGQLGPMAYNDPWFGAFVKTITASNVAEIFTPNPPTMALMAAPIAMLSPYPARALWLGASLASVALATLALLRFRTRLGQPVSPALVLVMLLAPAVFANLRVGQAYLIIVALLTAAALLLIRQRDGLAGVFLGLLFGLKLSGVGLLVLLVARRRFRAVVAAAAVAGMLAIVITPLIDPLMWRDYPPRVREFVARPSGSVTAYQSTAALFRHLCVADPKWNPSPAADCAAAAFAVPTLLIAAAFLVSGAAVIRSQGRDAYVIAAGICLSELSQPAAPEPHFALLAIPLALVPMETWLFVVVAALILVPLEYTAEQFTAGWTALLAYPRLYATWLLWALSIRGLWGIRAGISGSPRIAQTPCPTGPRSSPVP
jgi:hypothetical protein